MDETKMEHELDNLRDFGGKNVGVGQYWDELTGEPLPRQLTRAARLEELAFMDDWRVWDVVPVAMAW